MKHDDKLHGLPKHVLLQMLVHRSRLWYGNRRQYVTIKTVDRGAIKADNKTLYTTTTTTRTHLMALYPG